MTKRFFSAPFIAFMICGTLIPACVIAYYGLTDRSGAFTMANIVAIASGEHAKALGLSLLLAFASTVICLFLAFPLGLALKDSKLGKKGFMVFVFILPMWMNFLLRTMAWQVLLEKNGIINGMLTAVGLPSLNIINTSAAVILGMVYDYLPFMIYPIYTILSKMDRSYIEAAQDLGASPAKVFLKVTLPLSMPGVMSGVMMVFMPTVSTFAISEILTNNTIQLFGSIIQEQFNNLMWNQGAALSLVMLIIIGLSTLLQKNKDDN